MKAIRMLSAGPANEVLSYDEVDEPVIREDNQVKIAIKAAGVNPIDTKLRGRGIFYEDGLPAILGCDGAGEIIETGAAVSQYKVGDKVWYCHGGLGREQGNYAEFNVVPASLVRPMPANIDYANAAAGPLVLITAWEALFERAQLQAGQTVLVHAGAGGVGHVAIQLAKHKKARVITTISSEAKAEFTKALGADETINYKNEDFVEQCLALTNGRGVDVVFDTVGLYQASFPALKVYGHLVTLLDPGTDVVFKHARNRNLSLSFELMLTPMLDDSLAESRQHQCHILDECKNLIESGKLKLNVAAALPLKQAIEAHQMIEQSHTMGKIVLVN